MLIDTFQTNVDPHEPALSIRGRDIPHKGLDWTCCQSSVFLLGHCTLLFPKSNF
jgi:hypothetical protein